MGVRTLAGVYDGTAAAAVMVDSGSGTAFGPVWEGDEAVEQIDRFQDWLRTLRFMLLSAEIGLESGDLYDSTRGEGMDVREWPASGLKKLVVYWRREVWNE